MLKITHLTSAHTRYDIRIFLKMCTSLAANGHDVSLIVADGLADEVKNNVSIFDVGRKNHGRLYRMTRTVSLIFKRARELDSDIFHMHDPELLPIGIRLRKMGKIVIFDAHEDLPKQILSKPYLNKFSASVLSRFFQLYERWAFRKFTALVGATPNISERIKKINPTTVNLNNYPLREEMTHTTQWNCKKNEAVFVGGLSEIRGVREMVQAMCYTDGVKLNLVGSFNHQKIKETVEEEKGWAKVNEFGHLDRSKVGGLLSRSKVGLVTFLPAPNHVDAQPNKMFEYMAVGIPVIASNFPSWKQIIEGHQCGICVDPQKPKAIGDAIMDLFENPEKATQMGKNGRAAVERQYSWEAEFNKLIELYQNFLIK